MFTLRDLPAVVCHVLRLFHNMIRALVGPRKIQFVPERGIHILASPVITLPHLVAAHRRAALSEIHVDHRIVVVDD